MESTKGQCETYHPLFFCANEAVMFQTGFYSGSLDLRVSTTPREPLIDTLLQREINFSGFKLLILGYIRLHLWPSTFWYTLSLDRCFIIAAQWLTSVTEENTQMCKRKDLLSSCSMNLRKATWGKLNYNTNQECSLSYQIKGMCNWGMWDMTRSNSQRPLGKRRILVRSLNIGGVWKGKHDILGERRNLQK